jgi:hypothetical protein
MKLKIAVLAAMACAGVGASVALAHGGPGKEHRDAKAPSCRKLHVNGTLAAGSLVIAPKAHKEHASTTTTTTTPAAVTVAVPDGSRIEATACATVNGTTTTWSLRQAELSAPKQAAPSSGTTTVTTTVTVTTTSH